MDYECGTRDIHSISFSLTGGEGSEAFMFHKHTAQKISAKNEENYDRMLSLIRCKFSFLILRSILIMCQRKSFSK